MLTLVKSTKEMIPIEKEIMDSDPEHNLLSTGSEESTIEDLIEEHDETDKYNKERYLVKKDDEFISILDFTMKNPKDDKPWIGLLIIHKKHRGTPVSYAIYTLLENLMIEKGAKEIRLGCYQANAKAQAFWKRQGYISYKTVEYEGKPMDCLEKKIKALQ